MSLKLNIPLSNIMLLVLFWIDAGIVILRFILNFAKATSTPTSLLTEIFYFPALATSPGVRAIFFS